jgi:hypothetical protein
VATYTSDESALSAAWLRTTAPTLVVQTSKPRLEYLKKELAALAPP